MDLGKIKLDLDKTTNGIWEDLDGETSVLIARMYNPKFNKRFQELTENYQSGARKRSITPEKAMEILTTCLAETILIGWKGLKLNGQEVPYSVEKAKEILADPQLSTFRQMITEIADNESKYREEEIIDTSGK